MEPEHASGTPRPAPANPVVSAIIVLLTLIVVLVVLFKTYPPAGHAVSSWYAPLAQKAEDAWALATLPSDLRHAQFVTPNGTYRVAHAALVPATAAVAPEVQKVYALSYNASTVKANPRVSPGKTRVAFQQLKNSEMASSTSGWQVSVASLVNGDQRPLGTGVDPFFIDETHVGRFTEAGVVMSDVTKTGSSSDQVLFSTPFPAADFSMAVAPSQTVIAFKDASSSVEVYSFTPKGVVKVLAYDGPSASFALTDSALYTVNQDGAHTTVSRIRFVPDAKAQVIANLPANLGIQAISF